MKIVILDRATLGPSVALRAPAFEHELVSHDVTGAAQVRDRIIDADVVITNKVRLGADAISSAKNLKLVAIAATGTDNVDLAACAKRQIVVSNIRNYAINTVPEHTFALIFALRRSILAYANSVSAGRWQESGQFCYFDYPIRDLAVSADVILTHRVGVNLTHLGNDGGLLAADNVDSGASSGDQGNGASRRQHSGDGQAAGLLTQHDQAVSA